MVQRVELILEDDISGGKADETIVFAFDGVSYEIDLSAENAAKMREEFVAYIGHARRLSGRRSSQGKKSAAKADRSDNADVRAWLREQGHEVSDRGRIHQTVRDAYYAAH